MVVEGRERDGSISRSHTYTIDINGDKWWHEGALRKKHKGIDQSLEDMIKEINRGVKA
jgi:hypothetical protein